MPSSHGSCWPPELGPLASLLRARVQARPSPPMAFARPRLKIHAKPASLRMKKHTKQKEEAIVATTQEAVQISAIVPTLTVDDLQKSITFYQALGFAIDERWEEKGTLLGVMLRAGTSRIGLNQDDWKKGARPQEGNRRAPVDFGAGQRRRDSEAREECRHHAQVGAARHRVEDPRVRGHRSERFPADRFSGSNGVGY